MVTSETALAAAAAAAQSLSLSNSVCRAAEDDVCPLKQNNNNTTTTTTQCVSENGCKSSAAAADAAAAAAAASWAPLTGLRLASVALLVDRVVLPALQSQLRRLRRTRDLMRYGEGLGILPVAVMRRGDDPPQVRRLLGLPLEGKAFWLEKAAVIDDLLPQQQQPGEIKWEFLGAVLWFDLKLTPPKLLDALRTRGLALEAKPTSQSLSSSPSCSPSPPFPPPARLPESLDSLEFDKGDPILKCWGHCHFTVQGGVFQRLCATRYWQRRHDGTWLGAKGEIRLLPPFVPPPLAEAGGGSGGNASGGLAAADDDDCVWSPTSHQVFDAPVTEMGDLFARTAVAVYSEAYGIPPEDACRLAVAQGWMPAVQVDEERWVIPGTLFLCGRVCNLGIVLNPGEVTELLNCQPISMAMIKLGGMCALSSEIRRRIREYRPPPAISLEVVQAAHRAYLLKRVGDRVRTPRLYTYSPKSTIVGVFDDRKLIAVKTNRGFFSLLDYGCRQVLELLPGQWLLSIDPNQKQHRWTKNDSS